MACTSEIDHLITRVAEADDFDWADLNDVEWFVAKTCRARGSLSHNASTLKVLRSLVRRLDNSTETS